VAAARALAPIESEAVYVEDSSENSAPSQHVPNTNDWISDMALWLETVKHGRSNKVCSKPNANSVMRQVRKLASGEGTTYVSWPDDVFFYRGVPVDLTSDFDTMKEAAHVYEDSYGRDKGNGWLLRHPIEKMRLYRDYRNSQP
jgi:hypothetical protein